MPNRIESLTLQKFRGSTTSFDIGFDVDKPIAMIFGENGTGKSTIVDGIDFVCNEKFGSLNERSVPASSKGKLIVSLGEIEKNLGVSLRYKGQTWTGSIGSGRKPSSRGPQNRPKAHILRRSQILRIIDSQPKERYDAIKQYIEVPSCEKNEEALREALKNNKKDWDSSTEALTQSKIDLEELWKSENKPGKSYMEWAENKINVDAKKIKENIDKIDVFLDLYQKSADKYKEYKNLEEQQQIYEKGKNEAKEAFFKNQLEAVKASGDLIDVLRTAQSFFERNSETRNCPVCENEIDAVKVNKRIKERLAAMPEQVRLKDIFENAQKQVEKNLNLVKATKKQFIIKVKELLAYFYEEKLIDIIQPVSKEPKTFGEKYPGEDINNLSFDRSYAVCTDIRPRKEALENIENEMNKTYHQFNAIRNHVITIKEKEKSCKMLEKKNAKLTTLLNLLEKERKDFVESVLEDISGLVEEIYLKIHPDEGFGKIKFFLKPKAIGSLEFTGQFQDRDDVIPQAYYSESHLDTLGICVFLALAHRYKDDDTIVVMDDVLTSVDQVHMERFSKMLIEEASHFNQVIITTHYRAWRDRYRYGKGPSSNIQLIELLPWSISKGIRHTKTRIIVDELVEKLTEDLFNRQTVASQAGILLESLLDFLTKMYQCKLPIKPAPFYTLGEFLNGLNTKLRKSLKIEKSNGNSIDLAPLVMAVEEKIWIRNQVGAHFNIAGMDIADNEIKQMGSDTIAFANALICEECGQIPDNKKSGSFWECHCGETRLHPLTMPE